MTPSAEKTAPSVPTEPAPKDRFGMLYVLLSALCFALAGVFIKLLPWDALSISAGRSVFACVVLYVYLRSQGKRMMVNKAVIAGAFINFCMMQTFVIANKLTTAANSIVLQFTEPVWVIVLMWVFFHERPRRSALVACAVIFGGIVCFFFDQLTFSGAVGNVLAIVSGAFYAGVFLIKRIPGCDFECAAILSMLMCVVCGLPSLAHETDFSVRTLVVIVAFGVVQVGLAYVFLSKGLDRVPPVAASLTSTIEPIVNPLLVALVVGEMVGPLSLVGAVLVIGGSTAYNVYEARRTP